MATRRAQGTLQERLDKIENLLFRHTVDLDERDAEEWLAYGFVPEDVEALLGVGVTSAHAAAVIEDEGLSPKSFAARVKKKEGGEEGSDAEGLPDEPLDRS